MDASGNKQVVREWFDVFNTGDVTEFDRLHARSCRNHAPAPFEMSSWPADGQEFGPEAAAETVRWLRSNQPDLQVTIESMVAEDDQVVAWVRATGTPSGPGPIPPTGRSVDFHQAHRFRVQDGQVVEHWAVRDDLRSLLQAGVLTPPVRSTTGTGAPR
jgi:predicted ester cyclase